MYLKKIFTLRYWILIIFSVIIFVILSGIGMGVPIMNILFGFLVGWYSTRRVQILYNEQKKRFSKIFIYSLFCAGITLIIMLAIWGTTIPMLFVRSTNSKLSILGLNDFIGSCSLFMLMITLASVR